jgi:serine/threonine protein kinase
MKPGDKLGPYEIQSLIGAGGMGVVFEAEDPQLKRLVALKVMKPVLAVSDSARQRFLREAQATAALRRRKTAPSSSLRPVGFG